jgi:hypothetical protein
VVGALALAGGPAYSESLSKGALVVHVEGENGSDANPGSAARPLKTISRATELAVEHARRGNPVTVLISPGTYRESIILDLNGIEPRITIQAASSGPVIVSGSDVWTGWKRHGGPDLYSRPWPYAWGVGANPWTKEFPEEPLIAIGPRGLRREMVIVDGRLLEQVLSSKKLGAGKFHIDESQKTIVIGLSPGSRVEQATIEVATRTTLLEVWGGGPVTVRGMRFQHSNGRGDARWKDFSAVRFADCRDIMIEESEFVSNNWTGLDFGGCRDITVRRSIANRNGWAGMSATFVSGFLFEDNETSLNGWRSTWGKASIWDAAGIKVLHMHGGAVRGHRAVGNETPLPGFWLDTDIRDITMKRLDLRDNDTGLLIEAAQGPVSVSSSVSVNNRRGVWLHDSKRIVLENNSFCGNAKQIQVGGFSREIRDFETKESSQGDLTDIAINRNLIAGTAAGQVLLDWADELDIAVGARALKTLRSDGNDWRSREANGFHVFAETDGGENRKLDFDEWRQLTQMDAASCFVRLPSSESGGCPRRD